METNKLKQNISAEPWPDGLYPMSVRMKDSKRRYMTSAHVTISPLPPQTLVYETRDSFPSSGVTLDKHISQLNLLVPPGTYKITSTKADETVTTEVTVVDPLASIISKTWKDGLDFYYRDQRWDRYILRENSYNKVVINENDRVLDVGAHIGIFARTALSKGATVVCYEPETINYKLLQMNGKLYGNKFCSVNSAVVADDSDFAAAGFASLWIDADGDGDSGRSALHSLYRTRGARLPVNVSVVSWSQMLKDCNPTILKVDVEGAELTYDWDALSICSDLRTIALEIENKRNQQEEKQRIVESIKALGFTLVKETNGWATVQHWER